jgi:RNA polymerase sigma factor (sigma-70 family)
LSTQLRDDPRVIDALQKRDPEVVRSLVNQLARDALSGETHGLFLLSKAFRGKVIGWLARSYFNGDYEHAEEAWNDTLLRVWRRFGSYDARKSEFVTWLFNQARYAALDLLRTAKWGREVPAGRAGEDEDNENVLDRELQAEASRSFEEPHFLTGPEERALKSALARLSSTEQRLLRLRYVLEFEPVEIARLGLIDREIPETYIRVYINRAARRLRKLYEQELEAD